MKILDPEFYGSLVVEASTKIVLLVMDGLGGAPYPPHGKTELEMARTPNLNSLAANSSCGATVPVAFGVTPGSGPAHLSLFGYDPVKYDIGRGVLEALGMDIEMTDRDVAVRGNFATVDAAGLVTDRRAGRIPTEKNIRICAALQEKTRRIDDVDFLVKPGKEHRFALRLRGDGLSDHVQDTDPQKLGAMPLPPLALSQDGRKTQEVMKKFLDAAFSVLKDHSPANAMLLRGFAKVPPIPPVGKLFGIKAAAIATYPMYRGLARLVGMEVVSTGETVDDEIATLEEVFGKYDFFFVHVKKTDSFGEDGNFSEKVRVIEHVDGLIPRILAIKPDVLVVTSDHSTPALIKGHSWQPNPFLLWSRFARKDGLREFSETECARGGLGVFHSTQAMPLMLAHAQRFTKYGA